uniref:MTM0210 n=1 Tax=Volvox carteri f. nagariensis TaxID=3068 RepID=D9CJ51_VOLCA|nr:MTM0210 [Volvox carteri f. nagariensis]
MIADFQRNGHSHALQTRAHNHALLTEAVSVLTSTADGQYLAGGSSRGTLYVWELSSGRLLSSWPAHIKGVTALLFVGSNQLLLSGGEDTMLHAWLLADLLDPLLGLDQAGHVEANPKPLHTWCDHTMQVTALAAGIGEASTVLVSASLDRTVKLRRLADGCQLCSLVLPAAINDIALDAGEETLYAAGLDGVVYAISLGVDSGGAMPCVGHDFKMQAGAGYDVLAGHSRPVTCLALTSCNLAPGRVGLETNADILVSGSEDGTVRIWDLLSRQTVQVVATAGRASIKSIKLLPLPMLGAVSANGRYTSSHGILSAVSLSKYAGAHFTVVSMWDFDYLPFSASGI